MTLHLNTGDAFDERLQRVLSRRTETVVVVVRDDVYANCTTPMLEDLYTDLSQYKAFRYRTPPHTYSPVNVPPQKRLRSQLAPRRPPVIRRNFHTLSPGRAGRWRGRLVTNR